MSDTLDRVYVAKLVGVFVAALLVINALEYVAGTVASGDMTQTEMIVLGITLVALLSVVIVFQLRQRE